MNSITSSQSHNPFFGLAGLLNLNNTCYLNSILQTLGHISEFRTLFTSKQYQLYLNNNIKKYAEYNNVIIDISNLASKIKYTLSYQFERLFSLMWTSDIQTSLNTYSPISIKTIISSKYDDFNNTLQQDQQECLLVIFNIIEQETGIIMDTILPTPIYNIAGRNTIDNTIEITIVNSNTSDISVNIIKQQKQQEYLQQKYKTQYSICDKLFSIGQISSLICSNCHVASYKYDTNYCLFVEIPINSIVNIINNPITRITMTPTVDTNSNYIQISNLSNYTKLTTNSNSQLDLTVNDLSISNDNDNNDNNYHYNNDNNDITDEIDLFEDSENDLFETTDIFEEANITDETNILIEQILLEKANKTGTPKKHSLYECLDITFEIETLDTTVYCEKCKTHHIHTKQNKLWNLPKYLFIQLKRFDYSNNIKKNNLIDYDDIINIHKYIDKDVFKSTPDISTMYELSIICNHFGNMQNGHCYTYAKNEISKKWYKFDDSHISSINKHVTNDAYILIYKQL